MPVSSHLPRVRCGKSCTKQQISKQNERKHKAPHTQAPAHATTLIAKERVKLKNVHHTTVQVIQQVEGKFRVCGYGVNLSKSTIN